MKPKTHSQRSFGTISLCFSVPFSAAFSMMAFFGQSAHADNTWDGDGSSPFNWSDTANWGSNTAPSYGTISFSSSVGTTNTLDGNFTTGGNTNMNQINWNGSSAWVMNSSGGAGLSLFDNGGTQAKIESLGSGGVTINAPITFAATGGSNWGEINAVGSSITFGSSGTLTVNGSGVNGIRLFGGTGGIETTFNNTVSATGKYFSTSNVGQTVNVGGAFTSGDFYLMNTGTLKLNSGGALTTSALRLGGDFATTGTQNSALGATFQLTSLAGGQSFSSTINSVTSNTSGALLIDSLNTSGTNTLGGSIFLDSPLNFQQAAGGTLALTGVVSNASSLTKSGAGSLSLSNANTFSGGTTIKAGTLLVGVSDTSTTVGALGGSSRSVLLGDTSGSNNASLLTNGAFTLGNAITLQNGSSANTLNLGGNTASASVFSGAINLGTSGATPAKDATLIALAGGSVDFSGVLNEGTSNTTNANITVGDATHTGTVKLSNVANGYSGITTIKSGATLEVVKLAAGGSNSSIGNSGTNVGTGSAATDLILSGGTLRYTGAGDTTNRLFTYDANGATLDASAAANAALTFTGTGSLVASGSGNRTLTLSGASTGVNSLASIIVDPSAGTTTLGKTGAGTWTVSGANTYSGGTTVTTGTLSSTVATGLGSGTVAIGPAGTVTLVGINANVANAFTGNGVITLTGAANNTLFTSATSLNGFNGTVNINITGAGKLGLMTFGNLIGNGAIVNVASGSTFFSPAATNFAGVTYNLAGAGNSENLGAIRLDTGATIGSQSSVILAGNSSIGSNSGVVAINANISETGGARTLTNFGAGTMMLGGNNSYSGGTILSAGVLGVATDTAGAQNLGTLSSGITFDGGQLQITGTAITGFGAHTVTINAAKAFSVDIANAANTFTYSGTINTSGALVKAGLGTLVLSGTGNTVGAGAAVTGILDIGANGLAFSAGNLFQTGGIATINATGGGKVTLNIAGGDLGVNTGGTLLTVNPVIQNGTQSSIDIFGTNAAGVTVLAGANTYTGVTNIQQGILSVNSINSVATSVPLGTVHAATSNLGSPVTVANGTLSFGNASTTTGTLRYTGTGEITDRVINLAATTGGGVIDQSGASGNLKFTSALTATGLGAKTLTLQGSSAGTGEIAGAIVNSTGFTTAVTKTGTGTWTLSGTNAHTGITSVNGGTLKLDYSTNNTSKISDTVSALALGGGTLELAGGSHTEIVLSTSLTAGTASTINRTSGTSILNLNTITAPAGSFLNFGAASIANVDNLNTNGILGPWATVTVAGATNWATNSTNLVDGLVTAYTGYTNITRLGASVVPNNAANNVQITNGGTSGNISLTNGLLNQIYTLKMDASAGGATIASAATTDLLNIGNDTGGGILQTATSGGLTIGTAAGNGVLTTGGTFNATAATLSVINDSTANALTINSNIANNGTDVVSLAKSGAGLLLLNGANSYTGSTFLDGGTIRLGSSTALGLGGINGAAGALTLAGGTTLDLNSNSLTVASLTALTGNVAGIVTDNAAGSGTSTLRIFDSTANGIGSLITDGASRTVAISTANSNTNTAVLTNIGNTFSGGLTLLNGIGSNGTRLNPINGTIGTPGAIVSGPYGKGAITLGLAATDRVGIYFQNGNNTIVNALVINTTLGTDIAGLRVDSIGNVVSGAIQANLSNLLITANATSVGAISLTGPISSGALPTGITLFDGTITTGSITVTLANTGTANSYTGDTSIASRGILKLGAANQIPDGSGKGNVIVNGQLQLGGFSETINGLTGSGLVDGLSGTPTLTLGANNGTYNFGGTLQNSAGSLALVKTGTGTQMLSGYNTFGGGTTVSAGTLIGTRATALGINSGLNVAGSATFSYQPTAAGALSLGTGVLTLANGSTLGAAVGGTVSQSAITSSSAASVTGTVALNVSGIPGVAVSTGTHNLITAASGLNGGTFTLGNIYNASNFTVGSLTQSATAVTLGITSATALTAEYWKGGLSGGPAVWALSNGSTASNWASDAGGTATSLTPGTLADVIFSATGATNQAAMTLGANMSLKSLTIADTAATSLNADGNTLTLGTGGLTLNSGAGAATLGAAVATGAAQTWTNNSTNALTVTGGITNNFAHTLTGTGNITLGTVSGTGALTKSGTGTLTFSGADTSNGALTIAGGTAVVPTGGSIALTAQTGNQIIIGSAASTNAVMNVTGGSVSNTRLGAASIVVGSSTSNGALRISAGSVATAGATGEIAIGGGGGGYGALTVSGSGSLSSNSWFVVGGSSDKGVLNQTGGTINVSTNAMTIGAGNSSSAGLVNLSGGNFNSLNNGIIVGEIGTGTLNVSGTSVVNVLGNGIKVTNNSGSVGIANLLTGGTIVTNTVQKGGGTGTFNFNGGTLKANTNGATLLGGLTTSSIYANGAIIDTNGVNVTVSQALLAPAGSGIDTIAVTNGGSGYIGAPLVTLVGTVTGATATANMIDDGTGNGTFKVDTITITSPGINASGSITYTLAGGGAVVAATPGAVTIAANSAAGGLTKSGGGALSLTSQTSSFTGNVVVNGGVLATTVQAISTGLTSAFGNLTTVGKTITVNNGGTLMLNVNNALNNGTSPAATVVINSGGLVTANNFNGIGNITLNGGTLSSMNAAATNANFQAWALSGNITVGGSTPSTITSLSPFVGGVHLIAAGAVTFTVADVTGNANADLIVTAPLANVANSLGTATGFTKAGAGTMTLGGASPFTGNVNIDLGTIIADLNNNSTNPTSSALGNMQSARNIIVGTAGGSTANLKLAQGDTLGGANSLVVSTLVINSGGTVTNNGNNFNMLGPVVLNGGILTTTGGAAAGYQSYSLGGSVTSGGSAVSTISGTGSFNAYHLAANTLFTVADAVAGSGSDLNVSAPLINRNDSEGGTASAAGLTKAGAGTMTLSGSNLYTGTTTINAGTLAAGVTSVANVSGAFGKNSAIVFANVAGAVIDITGFDTQVGSLASGGALGGNVTLGAATLTTGGNNTTTSYAGVTSGTGGLIKIGTGVQTLSGANLYTGATTINAGTLKAGVASVANVSGAFGNNSAVTLANVAGAAMDITGFNTQIGSLAGGGATGGNITLGAATLTTGGDNTSTSYAGVISGTGGLIKTGTGTQTLTATNIFSGATTINTGGTLALGATGSIASSSIITANGTFDVSAQSGVTIGVAQVLKGSGTVNVGSGGNLAIDGVLAAGNSPGVLTVSDGGAGTSSTSFSSGSIFSWDLDTTLSGRGTAYDGVNTSAVSGSGAVFQVVLQGAQSFGDAFWTSAHTWSDIFTTNGTTPISSDLAAVFSTFTYANGGGVLGTPSAIGSFSLTGSTLSWSAVPEPTTALAGLLLGAGLLRRRRNPVGC